MSANDAADKTTAKLIIKLYDWPKEAFNDLIKILTWDKEDFAKLPAWFRGYDMDVIGLRDSCRALKDPAAYGAKFWNKKDNITSWYGPDVNDPYIIPDIVSLVACTYRLTIQHKAVIDYLGIDTRYSEDPLGVCAWDWSITIWGGHKCRTDGLMPYPEDPFYNCYNELKCILSKGIIAALTDTTTDNITQVFACLDQMWWTDLIHQPTIRKQIEQAILDRLQFAVDEDRYSEQAVLAEMVKHFSLDAEYEFYKKLP